MKLTDLTQAELLEICEKYMTNVQKMKALEMLRIRHFKDIMRKMEHEMELYRACNQKHSDILHGYEKLCDIPADVLDEAGKLRKQAQEHSRRWDALNRELDKYDKVGV